MEAIMIIFSENEGYNENNTLSGTDKEIMISICSGMTNKQIAAQIHLSPGTVRNRISTILGKLGLKNRTEIASYAVINNINENEK
jgi:DNA-binding NarL/FixJ family response regulator